MSCYNWEHGVIKLPASAYKSVRDAVLDAHNYLMDRALDRAKRVRQESLDAGNGKRGFDYKDDIYERLHKYCPKGVDTCQIREALFPYGRKSPKPAKPTRKSFPLANGRTREFRWWSADFTITFDPKAKTVTWNVEENNRAVERANAHPVAEALFRALRGVSWTSRTGGTIVGNDEYNRHENRGIGGGANYVTQTFGKDAKPRTPRRGRAVVSGRRW